MEPSPAIAVVCRPERPGEEAAVRALVADAFVAEPVVADLVDGLRVSPDWIDGLSFVAEAEDRLVAHLLFTRGLLDAPRRLVEVLVAGPLGVASDCQRQGIGSALARFGLEQVRPRAEPLVFLEGSPVYYPRFGFAPGGPLGFRRPSLRIPEEAFQVLRLPAYEPWMTGTLVYSRLFWDFDCVGLRDPGEG